MDIHERIHLQKVSKLEQLTPTELEQLTQDADAKAFIAENQAFDELATLELTPPSREAMLQKAFAKDKQASWTPPLPKLPWWKSRHMLRFAISAALIMAVAGILVITPSPTQNGSDKVRLNPAQPAWASEPGLVMACDAQTDSEEEAFRIAQKLMQDAQAVFVTQSEELVKKEAALNRAIKTLSKQRLILGKASPHRHPAHELSESEQESLKELQLNLTDVFEAIDLQSVELERIGLEIDQQEEKIFIKLNDLRSTQGKLSKIHTYAPKHEVRRLGNGRYAITVGFPGVELEPTQIAVELNGMADHQVDVSQAMFFVEKIAENTNEHVSHFGHIKRVIGDHKGNFSHTIHLGHNAPSPDAVRSSLAKAAFFVGNQAGLEIITESDGDKLVVKLSKNGESVHEMRSNELGEGVVWFSIPQLELVTELEEHHSAHSPGLENIDDIKSIKSLDSIGYVVSGAGNGAETNLDLNLDLSLDGLNLEIHGGGNHGEGGHTRMFSYSSGSQGALDAPGVVNLSELHGKIISILGDAPLDQEIKVLTTNENGVKVVQIVVDGEVTQEIRIKDGDCKVVVVEEKAVVNKAKGKRDE